MANNESKPYLAHLSDLRKLIIKIIIILVIGFIISFTYLCVPIIEIIKKPLIERGIEVVYSSVAEAFTLRMRVSLISSIVVTSPITYFLIWRFIKPALYEKEIKKYRFLFFICLILFLTGVLFCYFFVFNIALDFFLLMGNGIGRPLFQINNYLSFVISLVLPFGIIFEYPVIIYILVKSKLVNYEMLTSYRKYILLIIVTISAIITPPDVVSQIALSVPLYILYEIGIFISKVVGNKQNETKTMIME